MSEGFTSIPGGCCHHSIGPPNVSVDPDLVCLTRADLRSELQAFAEKIFEPQLTELAARMQKDLQEQLQNSSANSEKQMNSLMTRASSMLRNSTQESHEATSVEADELRNTNRKLSELAARLKKDMDNSKSTFVNVVDEVLAHRPRFPSRLEKKNSNGSSSPYLRTNSLVAHAAYAELADLEEEIDDLPMNPLSLRARSTTNNFKSTRDTMLKKGPTNPLVSGDLEHPIGIPEESSKHKRYRRCSNIPKKIVRHVWFERVVIIVILLNAIYIGVATDIMARDCVSNCVSETPLHFKVIEYLFLGIFIVEIGLRLSVHGCNLFRRTTRDGQKNQNFYWNILDCIVIVMQLIEMAPLNLDTTTIDSISVIRILRLVRLIRIIRVIKIFRFVRDLRMIVYAIGKSLSLFFWACLALLLLNFTCSVIFTEIALSHKIRFTLTKAEMTEINRYYGNLPITMLSLFQAVTGGIDWSVLTDCIRAGEGDGFSAWSTVLLLVAYVAFTLIAVLNVITGVFLDTAMDSARDERDAYVVRNARVIFQAADHNKNGTITWPDFESSLNHPDVQNFFEAVDIHISEAKALFDLLDTSGDGTISAEEFLNGCLRVRGPSKALDLLVLSREIGCMFESYHVPKMDTEGSSPQKKGSTQSVTSLTSTIFEGVNAKLQVAETGDLTKGSRNSPMVPFDSVVPQNSNKEGSAASVEIYGDELRLPGVCSNSPPS